MRALLAMLACAACGYPEPADKCEGPCALFAIDHPIAYAGHQIWLEGTFEDDMEVLFPGAAQTQSLDTQADHRVAVTVPDDATAGDLVIKTYEGMTGSVPFRRASFTTTLQPFMFVNEQGDYARTNYVTRVRTGATALTIGHRVYVIGGRRDNVQVGDIELAAAGLDGSMGRLEPVAQLKEPRAFHTTTRIGKYVYVIGGNAQGALPSVERAEIAADGTLTQFETRPELALRAGRTAHAAVIMGNHLYIIGGRDGTTDLGDVERAPIINRDGELGTFQQVAGTTLKTPRSHFTVALMDQRLFVIGGMHGGSPTEKIEKLEPYGTGDVSDFSPGGSLVAPRANHMTIVLGNDVYVIGGSGGSGPLASIETARLAQQDDLTFQLAGTFLREPKRDAAVTVIGNYVYVIGGETTGANPAEFVERASIIEVGNLTPFAGTSTDLVAPRSEHAVVVIGKWLYVIGGIGLNSEVLDTVEIAEIKPDGTLSPFASYPGRLLQRRAGHKVVVNDDIVYVIGGRDNVGNPHQSIEMSVTDEMGGLGPWAPAPSALAGQRTNFAMFATAHGVYVLGGRTGGGGTLPTSSIEYGLFNNGKDLNNFLAEANYNVLEARESAASIAIGPRIYVIGGVEGQMYRGVVSALLPTSDRLADAFADVNDNGHARAGHTLVLTGRTLHLIGGNSAGGLPPIERSSVFLANGELGPFSTPGIALNTHRAGHATVTIGNYVYVIGGESSTGEYLRSLERATIE